MQRRPHGTLFDAFDRVMGLRRMRNIGGDVYYTLSTHLVLFLCARAQDKCKPAYHNESMGVPLTSYAHSVAPTECAYAVFIMVVRSLRYRQAMKSYASLTAARDGGAAVAPHVGRGRGLRVLGAGIDEHDVLAQPRAAVGHGSGRNVPDRGFFSDVVTATRLQRASLNQVICP